nr:sigma-54 dependent transcriptional regulator [Desulforhopalus vacuolatus]
MVVDDDSYLLSAIGQTLMLHGWEAVLESDPQQALQHLENDIAVHAVVSDVRMPHLDGMEFQRRVAEIDAELPLLLITGHGDVALAVKALRAGAYDFLEKPVDDEVLLTALQRGVEKRMLVLENRRLAARLADVADEQGNGSFFHGLVGAHACMQRLYRQIVRMAKQNDPVLICGETGTGKELVARALHQIGRPAMPFVGVNMAAIPGDMVEAELFGCEQGAFTGAERAREGKFDLAGRGTIFLDEICSLEVALQGKLLRALEERSYCPLGSNELRPLAARVVASVNQDMKEEVAAGRFREDLFYRLNVFSLEMPPLKARREDIPLLIESFRQEYCRESGEKMAPFAPNFLTELMEQDWPGNVRELRNRVRRFCVLGEETIEGEWEKSNTPRLPLKEFVALKEREYLLAVLRTYGGKVGAVHKLLGLSRKGLYDKVNRYEIDLDALRRE